MRQYASRRGNQHHQRKVNCIREEYDLVCCAKDALDLELSQYTRLKPVFGELRDLKVVWTALSGIWSQIGELRDDEGDANQDEAVRRT
jgi:hypothetical protein